MSFTVVHPSRRPLGDRDGQPSHDHKLTVHRDPPLITRAESPNRSVSVRSKPLPRPPVPKKPVGIVYGQVVRTTTLHRESELKIDRCDSGGRVGDDLASVPKRDPVAPPLPLRGRHPTTASASNLPNGLKATSPPSLSRKPLHSVCSAPRISKPMDEFDKTILHAQSLHLARAPDMTKIPWFHPDVSRHVAESLLLSKSIPDGTFLLRKSSQDNSVHTLSVRYKNAVKHYHVEWDGRNLVFGLGRFRDIDEFLEHFSSQPVISGESGLLVKLKHPYPLKKVKEPDEYEEAIFTESIDVLGGDVGLQQQVPPPLPVANSLSLNSKEGFLTKLGFHRKNWKVRWFRLYRSQLQYFAECPSSNASIQPKRTIELSDASIVSREDFPGRPFCFKLVTRTRTFFMQAKSESEANEWVAILKWKLERQKQPE